MMMICQVKRGGRMGVCVCVVGTCRERASEGERASCVPFTHTRTQHAFFVFGTYLTAGGASLRGGTAGPGRS